MKIVSIDWDYFIEEDPALDWGHREDGFFLGPMWDLRRMHLSVDQDTKQITGTPVDLTTLAPFRGSEFSILWHPVFQRDYRLCHAESHEAILQVLGDKENLQIINIDAHHDICYGHNPDEFDFKVDCGSWAGKLMSEGRVSSYMQVYPEWRKKFPEFKDERNYEPFQYATEKLGKNFKVTHKAPQQAFKWTKADVVFICRSGCWVPPEYDSRFTEFCLQMGCENPIAERPVVTPQQWDTGTPVTK